MKPINNEEEPKKVFEKIKEMDLEELTIFLYTKLSKKGLKKTREWLEEEVSNEARRDGRSYL